ncbi:polyprenyl synthetase family protein [Leptospira wolffii]|uniref:polyprenyl synthetase family protein n=1 Tax=Leptospira wolffii TaxID=409998 RepID=UPI00034D57F2|nr:farnesyl diphosphate synthase [Leptospira wolffii]TGK62128.1 polyprenyl synthetase family protein [Leptospira wolffii]TGK66499.1 polyprenyl synthetase family protein [Leptospira wolffii]TGK74488.1 polyprenyl synthetase family protein [Leptospira wolffii]TGL31937.1 polyprenyl synthetase family protein [Leptospira wolffii]
MTNPTQESSIGSLLSSSKRSFEEYLEKEVYPDFRKESAPELADAMEYSLRAGGKRLRPILVFASYGRIDSDSLALAASLEFIHTYSLIHDDLPSMDNDDFRRGKPSLHRQFSEATAILAGDALQTYAFSWLGRIHSSQENIHRDLLLLLAEGSGATGMVSGQMYDLLLERNPSSLTGTKEELLLTTHRLKTGALIQASFRLGNRLRSDYKTRISSIDRYGSNLGLLFQITDDILDVEGTQEDLGKTPGKDGKSGKITYPSVYGMQACKEKVRTLVSELKEIGTELDAPSQVSGIASDFPKFFSYLPEYIGTRKN